MNIDLVVGLVLGIWLGIIGTIAFLELMYRDHNRRR